MLNHLRDILIMLRLIQPSEKDILRWEDNHYIYRLEGALKYGNYKTRIMAAESLGEVGEESSIPLLLKAMEDPIQNVSIAALNALEKLSKTNELSQSINSKRFNWVKKMRDIEAKRNLKKKKKHNIYRWERASKKSFDRVKEQLKRPMR